jgi:branched-chain amino acid transport system substrate-binding protein
VFGPAISKLSFDGILGPISFDKNGDLNDAKVTLYKAGTNSWGAVATVSAK